MQELEAFRRPNAHVPGGRRCGADVLALVQLCHHWSPARASRIRLCLLCSYALRTQLGRTGGGTDTVDFQP